MRAKYDPGRAGTGVELLLVVSYFLQVFHSAKVIVSACFRSQIVADTQGSVSRCQLHRFLEHHAMDYDRSEPVRDPRESPSCCFGCFALSSSLHVGLAETSMNLTTSSRRQPLRLQVSWKLSALLTDCRFCTCVLYQWPNFCIFCL